jgi:tetratricopeptide (TPR) repeat protein
MKKQFSLNNTYQLLGNDFISQGIAKFEAKDYKAALNSFEYNIKVASSDVYLGVIDSGIYFNAGLAAYNGKLYDKAIPYFKKCIELKYETTMPYLLEYQSYMALKDTVNAGETLQGAFKAYPDNQEVILQLVDFYMKNNKLQDAFSYIKTRIIPRCIGQKVFCI